jgi:hypothetical protein
MSSLPFLPLSTTPNIMILKYRPAFTSLQMPLSRHTAGWPRRSRSHHYLEDLAFSDKADNLQAFIGYLRQNITHDASVSHSTSS